MHTESALGQALIGRLGMNVYLTLICFTIYHHSVMEVISNFDLSIFGWQMQLEYVFWRL